MPLTNRFFCIKCLPLFRVVAFGCPAISDHRSTHAVYHVVSHLDELLGAVERQEIARGVPVQEVRHVLTEETITLKQQHNRMRLKHF